MHASWRHSAQGPRDIALLVETHRHRTIITVAIARIFVLFRAGGDTRWRATVFTLPEMTRCAASIFVTGKFESRGLLYDV